MHDNQYLTPEPNDAINESPCSKEAWPVNPIETYKAIESGEWGYLVMYPSGHFEFLHERPTDEEITERWGKYFG